MSLFETVLGFLIAYWWNALYALLAVFIVVVLMEIGRWRKLVEVIPPWFRLPRRLSRTSDPAPIMKLSHSLLSNPRQALERIKEDLVICQSRAKITEYSDPDVAAFLSSPRAWYINSAAAGPTYVEFERGVQTLLEKALTDLRVEFPREGVFQQPRPSKLIFLASCAIIAIKWLPFLVICGVVDTLVFVLSSPPISVLPSWLLVPIFLGEGIIALILVFHWLDTR